MLGVFGVILLGAGHFIDNRYLPLGELGNLLSAGIIPLIYIIIGLKVGTELSVVLEDLREE
jgi:multicomponent Na+:H+ antiporter subunit B